MASSSGGCHEDCTWLYLQFASIASLSHTKLDSHWALGWRQMSKGQNSHAVKIRRKGEKLRLCADNYRQDVDTEFHITFYCRLYTNPEVGLRHLPSRPFSPSSNINQQAWFPETRNSLSKRSPATPAWVQRQPGLESKIRPLDRDMV